MREAKEVLGPTQLGSSVKGRWQEGVFVCELCNKDCGWKQNLFFHMIKQHGGKIVVVKKGRGRPRKDMSDITDVSVSPATRRSSLDQDDESSNYPEETPPVETTVNNSSSVVEGGTTKWKNGVPPSYWVWGKYVCEVCKKDCGYANNLGLHRKRSHGLTWSQRSYGYNGEIMRRKFRNSVEGDMMPMKRKISLDNDVNTPVSSRGFTRVFSRAMPCYNCTNCNNSDCMKCKWCHDKKKYGGPGKLNKRCITRRCTNPRLVEQTETVTSRPAPVIRPSYSAGGLTKSMPCRACEACLKDDCGDCRPCLNKKRFGGPGTMNKRCKWKVCLTPKSVGEPSTTTASYVRRQPGFVSSKVTRDDLGLVDADISFEEEEDEIMEVGDAVADTKESVECFVEMGLLEMNNPDVNNIDLNEFEMDKSPQKMMKKDPVTKTIPINPGSISGGKCSVAVEYWQGLSTEEHKRQGTAVVSTGVTGDMGDLCLVCGAAGEDSVLVYCQGCCQSAHEFCIMDGSIGHKMDNGDWLCGQCVRCKVRLSNNFI